MKTLVLVFISIVIFACNPKQNKEIVKKEKAVIELQPAIKIAPSKLIFCNKTLERVEKITFINNVYMAFQTKDSSLIKPYIDNSVSVSIGNSISGGFSSKSISHTTLNNWTTFLNEIALLYGTSVCTKVENRAIEFAVNSCGKNNSVNHNTAYMKYIHYEKNKGKYILKRIGFYHGE